MTRNVRSSENFSTTSNRLGGSADATSSCSSIHVLPCGTNTALSPAASAGLMSDLGLLPIIHVTSDGSSYFEMTVLVGGDVFLGHNLHRGKIFLQSGAFDLAGLFGDRAFGHQDQVMALREILQRFRHAGQDLNRVLGDGVGESVDGFMQSRSDRLDRQPLEGLDQGMRETVQSVTVA